MFISKSQSGMFSSSNYCKFQKYLNSLHNNEDLKSYFDFEACQDFSGLNKIQIFLYLIKFWISVSQIVWRYPFGPQFYINLF